MTLSVIYCPVSVAGRSEGRSGRPLRPEWEYETPADLIFANPVPHGFLVRSFALLIDSSGGIPPVFWWQFRVQLWEIIMGLDFRALGRSRSENVVHSISLFKSYLSF